VRTLTEEQFRQEAEPWLKQLFADYDPAYYQCERFSPPITARSIVYPCHYGDFKEAIPVKCLVAAATALGDEGCYLTGIYRSETEPNHCFIPFSEMLVIHSDLPEEERHATLTGLIPFAMDIFQLETVIYSPQGKWALSMSHEHYGLLGGSPEFMAMIESGVPNLSQQVHDFFDQYRNWSGGKPHLHWVPPLLAEIYGPERAEALMAESKLDMTPPNYSLQAPQLMTEAELATERAIAAQKIIDLLTSGPTCHQN
jgi:hypothetical protein